LATIVPITIGKGRRNGLGSRHHDEEVDAVYVRVVRFTDVSVERIEALLARIEQSGGPPGVPATGLKMLFDETQRTAVVLQYFDTAEDMDSGARAFSAMDSSETPGTRASVDMCELKLELPRSSATEGELPELL
jgi:hypothetical protein